MVTIKPYDGRHDSVIASVKDEEIQPALASADVILLPNPGHADFAGPVFPAGTREFFRYLAGSAGDAIRVEVASTDDEYRELTLHSAEWILPIMLLSDPAAQVAIKIVSNYIYDKMKALLPGQSAKVSSDAILKTETGSFELHYSGPAETYQALMLEAIDKLTKLEGDGGK